MGFRFRALTISVFIPAQASVPPNLPCSILMHLSITTSSPAAAARSAASVAGIRSWNQIRGTFAAIACSAIRTVSWPRRNTTTRSTGIGMLARSGYTVSPSTVPPFGFTGMTR